MVRSRPTSLAPQLTRGDRDPCDPYSVMPAMERLVVEVGASEADVRTEHVLEGQKAAELQAALARRRKDRVDFIAKDFILLGSLVQ